MAIFFILLLYFPIDSWQNEVLEELQVRGYFITNTLGIRPYDIESNIALSPDSFVKELQNRLWLANLSLNIKFDTVKVARFKPMVHYNFSKFSLFLQPDVKFGSDSLPPSNVFKNLFSADYERVYVKYQAFYFGLFVGRERFSIGPSPNYNMLLSGYGPPLDWFHYNLSAKYITLSYYLSQLDDMLCKPLEYIGDTISTLINARRYLIIKRLDFTPVHWFNCSFSEAATFGGENYTLMPYHFNPLVFIHTLQHNWGYDANLFFHLDAKIFLKNFAIYSAILVDDYQLEPDPNGEPNHLGMNMGVEFADFLIKRTFWNIEYHRLSRWIYCIYAPYQRYMYYSHPIGFPFGPDCDRLFAKIVYHLNKRFDIFIQGSYLRKGESSVNSIWPIPEKPRIPGTSFPEDNFLSGTVEKILNVNAGVKFFYQKTFFVQTAIGIMNNENYHHNPGQSKNTLQLNIRIEFLRL